ncbi:MAG: tripartite tricarboxylate transporter permease [Synergistaceae bacterium]|jgi:putative tricarboxylic transport membrane protein|nr:tripartite tricarboxylate transporter permease [Synergistaceae bacterium]
MNFIINYNFSYLLNISAFLALFIGALLGMVIGALPGLGATIGCALLIPLTFRMDPKVAILALCSMYMSSCYGGSISSVLLGIPGTSGAVATVIDGFPMAKRGFPGKALGYSLYASTVGGLVGWLFLAFLTVPLSKIALNLADPELFVIGLIGLVSVSALGAVDPWKCVISLLLGLIVGVIGVDFYTGATRFTFNNISLGDGVSLVALFTGFYALSDMLDLCMGDLGAHSITDTKRLKCEISWAEFKNVFPVILKSGIIGTIFGIVPGLGGGPASFYSYSEAKRKDKEPETFGHGNPRGLSACESSNNAVVSGGMITLLTLGIPGTSTVAIISGALMMHGITPGPELMNSDSALVYTIFWGILLSIGVMFLLGKYTTSFCARILVYPNYVLIPIISILIVVGSYVGRFFMIDMWTAAIAGIFGFIMEKLNFSRNAFALSFVLAQLIEFRFRRSLMISRGDFLIFFNRPLCLILWVVFAYMIFYSIKAAKKKRADRREVAAL